MEEISTTQRERFSLQYVNQDFLPEVGAGPARLSEMSRQWQAHGASVTIVAGFPTRRIPGQRESAGMPEAYRGRWTAIEDWDGLRAIRSWVFTGAGRGMIGKTLDGLSFAISGYIAARRLAKKPDLIIASSPPFFPHFTGLALSRHYRVPLILELRDLWPDYMVEMGMLKNAVLRRMLFAMERWLLVRADHVVVVTESFRKRAINKGVLPERISVIPNGVDLERYVSLPLETSAGFDGPREVGTKVIGYLGTFGRGQGLEQVIRAATRLRITNPELRFVLIGDGPERVKIENMVAEHSIGDIVELRPSINRDATPDFYRACDIVLVPLAAIPIFQETIPSKIFEVMASGRPLIASLAGEGARIVSASGGGMCVPAGDDAALGNAILQLLALPDSVRRGMGASAREWVSTHFDRRVLADRYFDLFCRLLDVNLTNAPNPSVAP